MRARFGLVSLCLVAVAAPNRAPGADPPAAPVAACPPVQEAVLGTWERVAGPVGLPAFVEEYRPAGVWLVNGHEGAVEWLGEGRARFLVDGTWTPPYAIALGDVDELVAVDAREVGTVYRRTSPTPSIPPSCYDITDEIVGTWAGPGYTEVYDAGGAYRVNAKSGTWRFDGNGHLVLDVDGAVGRYWFALLGKDRAIALGLDGHGILTERH